MNALNTKLFHNDCVYMDLCIPVMIRGVNHCFFLVVHRNIIVSLLYYTVACMRFTPDSNSSVMKELNIIGSSDETKD